MQWLGSSEQFLHSTSHAAAVKCQLGLLSSEGSTGMNVPGGSLTWLVVDAGCWLWAQLVLSTRVMMCDLSTWLGLLEAWQLGSEKKHLKDKCSKRSRQKLRDFLWLSFRSSRISLLLASVSQASHWSWSRFKGSKELDPVTYEKRRHVCKGREGIDGVILETVNHTHFTYVM